MKNVFMNFFEKKNHTKIWISIFALAILVISAYIYVSIFGPVSLRSTPRQSFIVKLNEDQDKIIERLDGQHFFRNKQIFLQNLHGRKILPGEYLISKSMWPEQLARVLSSQQSAIWIQMPEGLRNEEVAEIFAKEFNWNNEQKTSFLDSANQGYIFPSTYLFKNGISGKEAAERLNEEFEKRTKNLFSSEKQKNEAIIMASLLQREAFNAQEMPLIAGIIYNRLRKNQLLQIDATIQYAIGTSKDWWPRPKRDDYKIESAYNTYVKKGLPPAPICNPSLPAIEAALNPVPTNLLYYLHDPTGAIHTAATFQEHLDNTRLYLRP